MSCAWDTDSCLLPQQELSHHGFVIWPPRVDIYLLLITHLTSCVIWAYSSEAEFPHLLQITLSGRPFPTVRVRVRGRDKLLGRTRQLPPSQSRPVISWPWRLEVLPSRFSPSVSISISRTHSQSSSSPSRSRCRRVRQDLRHGTIYLLHYPGHTYTYSLCIGKIGHQLWSGPSPGPGNLSPKRDTKKGRSTQTTTKLAQVSEYI